MNPGSDLVNVHPRRTARPLRRLAAMPAVLALLMVGCVSPAPVPDPTPAEPSQSPTDNNLDAARDEQRDRARKPMLELDERPSPWEAGGPVTDEFRETVCGVDLEPVEPLYTWSSRSIRPDGAQLIQTSRPIGQPEAEAIVEALRTAVADCDADERVVVDGGTTRTITYEVTSLPLRHDEAVAYRQTPGIPVARVFFAHGGCLVAFSVFGEYPGQEAALFDDLVQAVLDKA